MPGRQHQQQMISQQKQQFQNQLIYHQQFQQRLLKRKLQHPSLLQPHLQQQQLQQSLLQPTQLQSSQQSLMQMSSGLQSGQSTIQQPQPTMMQSAAQPGLQQNQLNSIQQSVPSLLQQHPQSVARQQQHVQPSIHQQTPSLQQQLTRDFHIFLKPHRAASVDSTAQTGHAGVSDLPEEIYQKIKSMRDMYFADINELYRRIALKFQQHDAFIPPAKPSEQYEKMKNFKMMLERTLAFLQISKNNIQPGLKERIPLYEKQIVNILTSNKKKVVPSQSQG
ncbi:mediator of RNA polymerase II transcription subunit 15a-like [Phoenix dactylifera]|uniref:Mediator of RNA polymerase II transcription subunit 15a-like n=1 Tax=Phoenix dactylifera TaxID=42345 RepID=A0A8B7MY86_PHODC|nr:mediator of RNA polymerase II transcription subunit 15a-like [Phoenix dactylifera]